VNRTGTVTRKGQVTIPAELRRRFNIKEGDAIAFRIIDGRLVLERGEDIVPRSAGLLAEYASQPPPTAEEFRQMAAEAWAVDAVERLQEG
jgi:AbrB family looped-hinge helix DNA binding protein